MPWHADALDFGPMATVHPDTPDRICALQGGDPPDPRPARGPDPRPNADHRPSLLVQCGTVSWVIEERRGELFLHGTGIGERRPYRRPGETGLRGTAAGGLPIDTPASCLPVPIVELRSPIVAARLDARRPAISVGMSTPHAGSGSRRDAAETILVGVGRNVDSA